MSNKYFDESGNLQTVDKKQMVEQKPNTPGAVEGYERGYEAKHYKEEYCDNTTAGGRVSTEDYLNNQKNYAGSDKKESLKKEYDEYAKANRDSQEAGIANERDKIKKDVELRKARDEIQKEQAARGIGQSVEKNNKSGDVIEDYATEEEKKKLKAMEEYQKALEVFEERKKEYLVRGAMMKCSCGSHHRRLNLPTDHGVYTNQRPMMNDEDSLPGDTLNIPTFGVCSSKENSTGGSILLKKDVPRNLFGQPTGEDSPGNVRGIPCSPIILTTWLSPKEDIKVGDGLAVTPGSFLVCKYKGIIEVVDSGQFDEETLPKGLKEGDRDGNYIV